MLFRDDNVTYFILSHLPSSLHDGRLPCMKMPMRYIFADSHVVAMKLR